MFLRHSVWLVLVCLLAGGGCGTSDEINPWSTCGGKCEDSPSAQTSLKTRYPIYFAHGFKSSGTTWNQVVEVIEGFSPEMAQRMFAGDVDPGGPLVERSQPFRRNLQKALDEMAKIEAVPAGDAYWKINIIAHSMGGLDSRYLLNHPKFNNPRCHTLDPCNEDVEMCCYAANVSAANNYASDTNQPEPCCATAADGSAIQWRDRIASVTTLSTPHRGSAFADWGVKFLSSGGGTDQSRLERLFDSYMGMQLTGFFEADHKTPSQIQRDAKNTFVNLSQEFSRTEMVKYPELDPQRIYSWMCAMGGTAYCIHPYEEERSRVRQPSLQDLPQRRDDPSCSDLPIATTDLEPVAGTGPDVARTLRERAACYNLPGPKPGMPPFFSFAGEACPGGPGGDDPCGDMVNAGLRAMYGYMYDKEGPNDGIVSVRSARFGLFMAIKTVDHLNWTQLKALVTAFQPADFYRAWIPRLQQAGY